MAHLNLMEFIYKIKKCIVLIISVSIAVVLLSVSLSGCAEKGEVQWSHTGTNITEVLPSQTGRVTSGADTASQSITATATSTATATATATATVTPSPEVSDEIIEKPFVPYTTFNFFTLKTYNNNEYLLHEPASLKKNKKYPILVFLHGSGEHTYIKDVPFSSVGGDLFNRILFNINTNPNYYESYVIVPVSTSWGPNPYTLNAIINTVITEKEGDADRLYITGASMGGFATTDYVFSFPEKVACAVPISGATYSSYKYDDIINVPIRIYHSKDDNVVPVNNSRNYYNGIIASGGNNAEYFELSGFGHYPYSYVYTQTDTLEWMYKQNRKSNNSSPN